MTYSFHWAPLVGWGFPRKIKGLNFGTLSNMSALSRSGLIRFWKWGVVLGLAVLGAIFAWSGSAPEVQTTPVVQAYPSQTISVLNATGYVVAQRKAALSSKATGRLEWLGVTEGSVVKAGQIIARLESRDTQAQFEQAQAQVGVARAELVEAEQNAARSEQLLAKKFISPSSHDTTIAKRNRANAALASAQANERVVAANLAQTEIRAPFDGVVLTKNANVGDNITPFSSAVDSKGAVVTIADMSTLEVETDVSESNIGKLRVGQPAEVALDALPGERFPGAIARMVPTIDRSKATRLVKIKFDAIDPRVLPDMSAKVVFLERQLSDAERKPIIAVSRQAVVERGGKNYVYLVEDGRVKEVSVDIVANATPSELVPVTNLKPGQRVVIRPVGLRDGGRIKVVSS
jgi:RND family efflux transporter MFP subunit